MTSTTLINTVPAYQCFVTSNPSDNTSLPQSGYHQSVRLLLGARQVRVQHSAARVRHVASPIEEAIINMTVDDGSEYVMDGTTRAMRFAVAVMKLEDIFGGAPRTQYALSSQSQAPGLLDPTDPIDPSTIHSDSIIPPTALTIPNRNRYYDDGSDSTWQETLERCRWFPIEDAEPTEYLGSFTTSSGSSGQRRSGDENGNGRVLIDDRSRDSGVGTGSRSESDPNSPSSPADSRNLETKRRRVEESRAGWLRWMRRRVDRGTPRREEGRDEGDRRDDEGGRRVGCWGSWKGIGGRDEGRNGGGDTRIGRIKRWIGECVRL